MGGLSADFLFVILLTEFCCALPRGRIETTTRDTIPNISLVHMMQTKRVSFTRKVLVVGAIFVCVSFLNIRKLQQFVPEAEENTTTNKVKPIITIVDDTATAKRALRRSTLALGSRQPYSSHFCIGPKNFHDMYRSCHFTDVCFAPPGSSIPVPTGWAAALVYISDKNITPNSLRTSMVRNRHMLGPNQGNMREDVFLVPHILTVEASTSFRKVWSPVPLAIPFQEHNGNNFGHALGDNAFTLFRILELFNFYSDSLDFLPLRFDTDDCLGKRCCPALHETLYPFLYNRGFSYMSKIQEEDSIVYVTFQSFYERQLLNSTGSTNTSIPTLLCFENVLSGLYLFSDHGEDPDFHGHDGKNSNPFFLSKGDVFFRFRQAYMRRAGLDEDLDLQYHTCDHKHRTGSIVIIARNSPGEAFWWNVTKLTHAAEKNKKFQSLLATMNITYLGLDGQFSKMKEQVQIAAQAKVLVSMAGGASLISWFLPPGSTALLLQRHGGASLDSMVYSNIPYFHAKYVNFMSSEGKECIYDWDSLIDEILDALERYDKVNRKC